MIRRQVLRGAKRRLHHAWLTHFKLREGLPKSISRDCQSPLVVMIRETNEGNNQQWDQTSYKSVKEGDLGHLSPPVSNVAARCGAVTVAMRVSDSADSIIVDFQCMCLQFRVKFSNYNKIQILLIVQLLSIECLNIKTFHCFINQKYPTINCSFIIMHLFFFVSFSPKSLT